MPGAPTRQLRPARYYAACIVAVVLALLVACGLLLAAFRRPELPRGQAAASMVVAVSERGVPLRLDAFYEERDENVAATISVRTRPAREPGAVTWALKVFNVVPTDVACKPPVTVTPDPDNPRLAASLITGTARTDTTVQCTVRLPPATRVVAGRDRRLILPGLAAIPFREPFPLGPEPSGPGPIQFAGRTWYEPAWFNAHAALNYDWVKSDLVSATPAGYGASSTGLQWRSAETLAPQIVLLRSHRRDDMATFSIVLAGALLGMAASVGVAAMLDALH